MKLSISLPDVAAKEIRMLASKTDKSVSWWLFRAWQAARTRLLREEGKVRASHQKFLKTLGSLQGVLKKDYPDLSSVDLAHRAFLPGK